MIDEKEIQEAAKILMEFSDEVEKRYGLFIDKWVAFTEPGIDHILHGRVKQVIGTFLIVRCKNGCRRFININKVLKIFDNKKECYMFVKEGDEPKMPKTDKGYKYYACCKDGHGGGIIYDARNTCQEAYEDLKKITISNDLMFIGVIKCKGNNPLSHVCHLNDKN